MLSHLDDRTWGGEYIIHGEFLQECCILDLVPYGMGWEPPPLSKKQKTHPNFLKMNFNVLTVFIILPKCQSLICTMIKAFYVENLLVEVHENLLVEDQGIISFFLFFFTWLNVLSQTK